MFRTMLSLFFNQYTEWRVWAGIAKLLLIVLCIAVILFISWKKTNNLFCKTCKKRVKPFHQFCNHCGAEMISKNKEVIIGVNKKTKVMSVLAVSILSIAIVFSVVQVASSFHLSGYGTGIYTGYRQTYTENDRIWGVECVKALSSGSFREILKNPDTDTLLIQSQSSSGSLILNMKQGDMVESVDISNTNGTITYDLSKFSKDSEIELSVEHTTAKDIQFKISWG